MKEENTTVSIRELKRQFRQGDGGIRRALRNLYPSIFDYPYYAMCGKDEDSVVVLFTDYRTGTIIKEGCGFRLGGRSTDIIEEQFTRISGITPIVK